jgi:hypothetical protein
VVAVPNQEFVAADAPDEEFSDLEFVADGTNKREFGLCSGKRFKVANHRLVYFDFSVCVHFTL